MTNAKIYYRIGTFINIGIPQQHITATTLARIFAIVSSNGDVLIHETDWDTNDESAVLWFIIDLEFAGADQDWLAKALAQDFELMVEGGYRG